MPEPDIFKFKQFEIAQDRCSMKVGTDGVLLGAWAEGDNVESVLDIGAGTGLIALMIAQRYPKAHVDAIEVDVNAYEEAKYNAARSPWADQIRVLHQSIQEYARQTDELYNMIISNPPFFTGGTFSHNQDKTSVRHTVKLPHGDLLRAVRKLLDPNGTFSVILPKIEGLRLIELAVTYNLFCNRMTEVFPKEGKSVERLLLSFGKTIKERIKDKLIINHESGVNNWTNEFKALTGDFYLTQPVI